MEWNYKFEVDYNDDFEEEYKEDNITSGLIFLIDCGQTLFNKEVPNADDKDSLISWFEAIIKSCLSVVKNKAIATDKDCISIIFYRVKNETDKIMKTVHCYQTLDQPGIKEIKTLLKLQSISMNQFNEIYEFSEQGSLYHALWCCQSMFMKCKTVLGSKQILLFTYDDNPCGDNETIKKTLLVKAQDLQQNDIHLEIIPLANPNFKIDKFYGLLLEANTSGKNTDFIVINNPVSKMEELTTRIRHKQYRKRTTARISFFLGNDSLPISVGVYNLIRKAPPLSYVLLDRKSNMEISSKHSKLTKHSCGILMPSEIKYCVKILGKSIYFKKEEINKLRSLVEPGIRLLGFKPLKYLLPHYQVRSAQFIYPDETVIKGSTRVFSALLKRCIERKLFALCIYAPRKSSQLHYVALLPQKQKMNSNMVQLQPHGFALIFLPFKDDIRSLDMPLCENVADEDREVGLELIKSLCVEYEPETILNPVLQKQLAYIEAIALEQGVPDQTEDNTIMDNQEINKHCGDILEKYKKHFQLSFQTSSTATKSSKPTVEIDLKQLYKLNKLDSATVIQLKEAANKLKIKITGSKKADIIKSICSHLEFIK